MTPRRSPAHSDRAPIDAFGGADLESTECIGALVSLGSRRLHALAVTIADHEAQLVDHEARITALEDAVAELRDRLIDPCRDPELVATDDAQGVIA